MNGLLPLATVLLIAVPGPKNVQYEVVYGICIATTTDISGYTKSTFAIVDYHDKKARWQDGEQVDFEYLNANLRYFRLPRHDRFLLPPFEPGDASFLIVTRDSNKKMSAVIDYGAICRDALPHPQPYALIHKLTGKDALGPFAQMVPDSGDTYALATAIRIANNPKATKETREEMIADAQRSNKYVKKYVEWLLKKDDK